MRKQFFLRVTKLVHKIHQIEYTLHLENAIRHIFAGRSNGFFRDNDETSVSLESFDYFIETRCYLLCSVRQEYYSDRRNKSLLNQLITDSDRVRSRPEDMDP